MTSVLNYYGDPSRNSIAHLQAKGESDHNSHFSNLNQTTALIANPSSIGHTKPVSLLETLKETIELGDILTKKIKTQSTNLSEGDSHQQLSISRSSDETVFHNLLGSKQPTTVDEHFMAVDIPSKESFESIIPSLLMEDSYQRFQQALEMLQKKLLIERELSQHKPVLNEQISLETLSIPPFLTPLSFNFNEPSIKKEKKQNDKKARMILEEQEVTYGSVEFPFLSMSFELNHQENIQKTAKFQFPSSSLKLNKPTKHSKAKTSSILAKLPSRLSSLLDDEKQEVRSAITDLRNSLAATREETQISESELGMMTKETKKKKKCLKIIEEKKEEDRKTSIYQTVEIASSKEDRTSMKGKGREKERTKMKQEEEEDIYSPVFLTGKRQRERKLNRWQLAQAEKQNIEGSPQTITWGATSEKKKFVETPIGPLYQVDISALIIGRKAHKRRKPKMIWNPLMQNQAVLQKFFDNVRKLLHYNVNEEDGIELLINHNNNIKKTLAYIRANKAKCLNLITAKYQD
jgi:hypothetical protein